MSWVIDLCLSHPSIMTCSHCGVCHFSCYDDPGAALMMIFREQHQHQSQINSNFQQQSRKNDFLTGEVGPSEEHMYVALNNPATKSLLMMWTFAFWTLLFHCTHILLCWSLITTSSFESGKRLKHAGPEATGTKIEKRCCRKNTNMVISDRTCMSTHASDLQSTSTTVILLSCVMNLRTWINSVWAALVLNVVCAPLTVYWQCELPETRHACNELTL